MIFLIYFQKFDEENIADLIFFNYKLFLTGDKCGLIEFVKSKSVKNVLDDNKSITNFLLSENDFANELKLENYAKSCGKIPNFIENNFNSIILH